MIDDATNSGRRAYDACRSGSGAERGVRPHRAEQDHWHMSEEMPVAEKSSVPSRSKRTLQDLVSVLMSPRKKYVDVALNPVSAQVPSFFLVSLDLIDTSHRVT